jgi:hypothetical protein
MAGMGAVEDSDTSIAFQYNQANTEPPQTLLWPLPRLKAVLSWDYLTGAVNEAL